MLLEKDRKKVDGMERKLYLSKGNYEHSFLSNNLLCQYIYILVKYRANKINQKQLEPELNGYKVQHYNQRKEPP